MTHDDTLPHVHPDDICNTCTFELTPERICERDHCPHTFMKRTGKPLTVDNVMAQVDAYMRDRAGLLPKPAAEPEVLDMRGYLVPGTDGLMKFVEDEHGPVITQPAATQAAGPVVLTREDADWLMEHLAHIRAGIVCTYSSRDTQARKLNRLAEIEQALK